MKKMLSVLLLGWSFLSFPVYSASTIANDVPSIAAMKTAKGVYFLNIDHPRMLAGYLKAVEATHTTRGPKMNLKLDPVVVVIGPTVQFLTNKPLDKFALEFPKELASIKKSVAALHNAGVRFEVCEVAAQTFGVEKTSFFSEMHFVSDGFLSLIGWQEQGYSLIR